ncbi:MAG: hypothetical protein ACPKOI_05745 [Pleomorphochaeta sp.]
MAKVKIKASHVRDQKFGNKYYRAGLELIPEEKEYEVDEKQLKQLENDKLVRFEILKDKGKKEN